MISYHHRCLRFARPGVILAALLQRAPMCDVAGAAAVVVRAAPMAAFLRPVAIFLGLGAVDSLAGASVAVGVNSSSPSPQTESAGKAMTPVVFSINSSLTSESWTLSGTLPPGVTFGDITGAPVLTAAGAFNSNLGNPNGNTVGTAVLKGTPTTPGSYTVRLTAFENPNENGAASSVLTYTLKVTGGVTISVQPSSQYVASGSTVVFLTVASDTGGGAVTYQWFRNGVALAGATAPRLVVSHATAADAGNYHCQITGSSTSATTTDGTLTIATASDAANPGRLINLSVLANFVPGQTLTVGLFTSAGNGPEPVLVRGMGPTLAGFGVAAPLADPTLSLFLQNGPGTPIASNDNWGSNQAAVVAADAATGAFPPASPTSLDAALVATLSSGKGYTAAVTSTNAAAVGTALAEFYDNTSGYTTANTRMVNLSTLTNIVAGGSLTAGFVVGGSTARTVLVRAVGPSLAQFGIAGFIPDPQESVFSTSSGSILLASNAGWGGDAQLAATMSAVGAFTLTSNQDSVLLLTLPKGNYTAQASSISGTAGTVIVEVYEVP